jgi:exfoliative toxin A/B
MKNVIKKVPVPICGVMLGTAALGNLLQSYSEGIRYFCGVMAAILLILFLLKLICFPNIFIEDMKNPITASVFATFPMAIMLLSTYIKKLPGQIAFIIWLAAILLHIVLIIYFTVKFMLKLQMPKVFASYFIVYVGIAVAAVTAPVYEQTGIGTVAFWFGFVTFVLLFVLITSRYIKYKDVPEPARPLMCIYTAPLSLCIAGYIQSVTPKSFPFLAAMLIVATLLYIFALIKAIGYLRLPFYPSYAAFTFPFVISAIAAKQAMTCATNMGTPIAPLSILVPIETVIAVVLVVYTYVRFIIFISKK